jgi:hypothetical protein
MLVKEIVKLLMSYVMREATKLAGQVGLAKQLEKIQNRKDQVLSLIGVGTAKLSKAVDSVKNLI